MAPPAGIGRFVTEFRNGRAATRVSISGDRIGIGTMPGLSANFWSATTRYSANARITRCDAAGSFALVPQSASHWPGLPRYCSNVPAGRAGGRVG